MSSGSSTVRIAAPDRQLPAHVRLGGVGLGAGQQRMLVQRAARSGREAGPVEEDAGAVDDPRLARPVLLFGPVPPMTGRGADVPVLPLVLAELGNDGGHPTEVVLVGEVRTEGAAAVVRAVGVDPPAPDSEDAGPVARQPGEVTPVALVRRRQGR